MKAAILVACLVAGCASYQTKVARQSSPVLCYVVYAGTQDDRVYGGLELQKRGFTCTEKDIVMGHAEYQNYLARDQASRDAAAAMAIQLLTPPTAPQPLPRPLQCYTTPNGRTTTCQ